MFNKAWYYQNRGTNIKSHAHTTEFHLQNVPWEASTATPGSTQACGPGGREARGGGWAGRGGRRGGRLKTVHIKAQKEPANGIITMIQVQIKAKIKGPRLIRQATLPRAGRPPWPGHPGGARPPSLRLRPALALALTRSIGNTEGYFVFGASNLGQTSPPRNR
ncbi:unnamed protein product [Rangifer tarandus platyrhynchus]|uniref:Uncharacterized protein n=1 Tax=Rangifer tarandus platyrhynchus TaxID=3082113 RepID=A0ABN8XSH4_RANTA|nr:unnamed protein product [Rangifer tarandus platyrhynchus]